MKPPTCASADRAVSSAPFLRDACRASDNHTVPRARGGRISAVLGSSLYGRALVYWAVSAAVPFGAWHVHKVAPTLGLVLIGLTPFVVFFLFFRGVNCARQSVTRFRTVLRARRCGLDPTWGSASGGFLLVDEGQRLWAANGCAGHLDEIERLEVESNGLAHTVCLHRTRGVPVRVGFDSPEEMERMCARLAPLIAQTPAVSM